jgi:exodeoxyribonuclease VII large subunit
LKRPLPLLPKRICIVTSPTGAAVRDILRTIARRYPHVQAIVVPAIVQGAEGVPSIIRSLKAAERQQPDVIILARGGGSLEDLWCFNDESVARAIVACRIPVISGVGHETDTTIADFVADMRASTPTAAAEQAVPDAAGLRAAIDEWQQQMSQHVQYQIDYKRQMLDDYSHRLKQSLMQFFTQKRHELSLLEAQLAGVSHENILQQGYSLTLREGQIITSAAAIAPNDTLETVFADGRVRSKVQKIIMKEK